MKQHITPKQWAELSPAEKEKAREFWKPEKGNSIFASSIFLPREEMQVIRIEGNNIVALVEYNQGLNVKMCEANKAEINPLFSIGQMIEILRQQHQMDFYTTGVVWHVQLFDLSHDANGFHDCDWEEDRAELCDVLWEAVKKVLEG